MCWFSERNDVQLLSPPGTGPKGVRKGWSRRFLGSSMKVSTSLAPSNLPSIRRFKAFRTPHFLGGGTEIISKKEKETPVTSVVTHASTSDDLAEGPSRRHTFAQASFEAVATCRHGQPDNPKKNIYRMAVGDRLKGRVFSMDVSCFCFFFFRCRIGCVGKEWVQFIASEWGGLLGWWARQRFRSLFVDRSMSRRI